MLRFIFTDVIFYKKKYLRENWLQLIRLYKSTQIILKFGSEHQTIRAFFTRGTFARGKKNTDILYAVSVFVYYAKKHVLICYATSRCGYLRIGVSQAIHNTFTGSLRKLV